MSKALVASPEHVSHCFDALIHHLSEGEQPLLDPVFENVVCPLFVTWNKSNRHGEVRLRGCIGTFEARALHQAVQEYSLTSAIHDRRFDPITLSELPYLQCTVSLLHSFESGQSWEDWEIGVHGITIEFIDPHSRYRRSATFLPEVAAHENWDKKQTMQHLIHKSGCTTGATTSILNAIKLTRYQSTTCSLTYDEYMKFKDPDMFRGITTDKSSNEEAITVPA